MDCALPVLLSFDYPGHDASCPYINSETSGPVLVKTGDTCPSRMMIVPDLLNQLTVNLFASLSVNKSITAM